MRDYVLGVTISTDEVAGEVPPVDLDFLVVSASALMGRVVANNINGQHPLNCNFFAI